LRYDSQMEFTNVNSWSVFDANSSFNGTSFNGGCYDGSRYIYFAPILESFQGLDFVRIIWF